MIHLLKRLPLFETLLKKTPPQPLGRWSLIYNEKTYQRADLSNEDHCGPCGTYTLQQTEKNVPKMHVQTRINKKK